MYALVYAPHGLVGEDGSKVVVTDTYEGVEWELKRQVVEYLVYNELDPLDRSFERNEKGWLIHATAELTNPEGPEWHVYHV